MKYAHIADVHLGHRQYTELARGIDMYQMFGTTVDEVADADPDVAVIAGDLFQRDKNTKMT